MSDHVKSLLGLVSDGIIRYSTICANLARRGESELLESFNRDLKEIGQECPNHGFIEDPIILIETGLLRIVVACPFCSDPELLAKWEAQEIHP